MNYSHKKGKKSIEKDKKNIISIKSIIEIKNVCNKKQLFSSFLIITMTIFLPSGNTKKGYFKYLFFIFLYIECIPINLGKF